MNQASAGSTARKTSTNVHPTSASTEARAQTAQTHTSVSVSLDSAVETARSLKIPVSHSLVEMTGNVTVWKIPMFVSARPPSPGGTVRRG